MIISIHAAREGGDANRGRVPCPPAFQSTPPVKAATQLDERKRNNYAISIHAAREGGDDDDTMIMCHVDISIHAAREGGDA